MRGKRKASDNEQIKDERTFFSWVEKSLQQKGFEVIETLPRRHCHHERQGGIKNYQFMFNL